MSEEVNNYHATRNLMVNHVRNNAEFFAAHEMQNAIDRAVTCTDEEIDIARLLHRLALPERDYKGEFVPAPCYLCQATQLSKEPNIREELVSLLTR